MACATGELAEYMEKSRDRQAGVAAFTEMERTQLESGVPACWLEGLQSYTKRWVEEHQAAEQIHGRSWLKTSRAEDETSGRRK